jgi:cation diffusion facilitator CzcD-associated flavoprotein CzcO
LPNQRRHERLATGILLKSGRELEADIIVTATGLDIQMLGGMELRSTVSHASCTTR